MLSRRILAASFVISSVACASHETTSNGEPSSAAQIRDTDAAVGALAERSDQLRSFALHYVLHGSDGDQQITLKFRAPDVARLDVKDANVVRSIWIREGSFSLRGDVQGAPITAELSLAEMTENDHAFDAALERDFHGSMAANAGGAAGPIFQIELLPPDQPDDHGTLNVSVAWYPHALHRFSWLQPRGASNPWRSEGGEFARDVAGSGTIRISKETGFVTRMSHPTGFDFRLVSAAEDVGTSDFEIPPAAPGAKDLTPELASKLEYDVAVGHRRTAYTVMLRGWSDSGDGLGFDERVKRVFAEVYRPLCIRFDADVQEQRAANVADFVRGFREVNARTDGTQEQRAAVAAEITRWKDSYEQGVISYGDHYIAGVQVPDLDGADPPLKGVTPERLTRLLALERAAYRAEFHERVVQPAKARLDAALRSDDPH